MHPDRPASPSLRLSRADLPTSSADEAAPSLLSPTILRAGVEAAQAYELKFVVGEAVARQIEDWAAHRLQRDAYAATDGSYQTTTLYLDTPSYDVLRKTEGFRGEKHRLRRYALEPRIYLERKCRRGDRVEKQRSDGVVGDLSILRCNGAPVDWTGHWFRQRVTEQRLQPACVLSYDRNAYVQASPIGPIRLTLDRRIRGVPTSAWGLTPVDAADPATYCVLPDRVVCEFKFRDALPSLFAELIAELKLQPGSMSKYGHIMTAAGIARDGGPNHA